MRTTSRIRHFLARSVVVVLVASVLVVGPNSLAHGQGELSLANPSGITFFDGGLFIVESSAHRVNRVDIATGTITRIAGNGTQGFSGDGGAATNAQMNFPRDVAIDTDGKIYITDADNHRVRMVDTNGTITTIAGDGTFGFSGDGGPATNAQVSFPYGVAVDTSGNIYLAGGSRVRMVDTNGTITTIAGDGTFGFSGDGGPATNAQVSFPRDVAVDTNGNIYIADTSNHRVRVIDTNGTITTIEGDGAPGVYGGGGSANNSELHLPTGVTVDPGGNVYIADTAYNRIRKVDTNGFVATIAGIDTNGPGENTQGFSGDGGPATEAQLRGPGGVAVTSTGDVYITDSANNRIRKIDPNGIITTIAGDDTPLVATCNGLEVSIDLNLGDRDGLTGTFRNDVILGTPGDDIIDGGAGHDTICAGDGDDVVIGGDGDDVVIGGDGDDVISGDVGNDILRGGPGVDEMHGGDGNDRVLGGIGNDTMTGGEDDDYLGGFGGADTISGGPGNDRIFGGFGADIINGGPGDDVINGLIGNDTIYGDDGNDTLNGDRGNDTINGDAGNDELNGGNASDILTGGTGDDELNGGRADDTLSGGPDNDTCVGNKEINGDTADNTCELVLGVP